MENINQQKGVFMKLYKLLPKKVYFILGTICLLGISFTEILTAYFIQEMTNAAVNQSFKQFYPALTFLLVIAGIEIGFSYFRTRFYGIYSESGLKILREKLAKQYNDLDMETFSENHTGDYVSRATNDVNKVKDYLTNVFPGLIWNPVTGIGAIIYLIYLSWQLTLISLAMIPLVFIILNLISKPLSKVSKKLQEKLSSANSLIQDYIKGVEVSKAYHLEEVLGQNYNKEIDHSVQYGKQIAKRKAFIETFSSLFSIIPFFITFFVGGYYVIQNQMSVGGLLAFISLLNYVTNPIVNLPRLIGRAKVNLAACSRIFDMFDGKKERVDGNSFHTTAQGCVIDFQHVCFKYNKQDEAVLKDIHFTIHKGEKVALVGPSGGGKSTIMRLLLGYYSNYDGTIKIFGEELQNWNLQSLRNHLALVSQDTYLFPESIYENISYGRYGTKVSMDEITEAAKVANAHSFIKSFQDSYDTTIGELGNRLSGGQKQRISIARAVVKSAEILLLDEATSSLDNESESIVQDALERLMKNKTSIIIAHRLSTIKNVDRILVIDKGMIVEDGSHDELLQLNGLYSSLYQKQMKLEYEEKEELIA